MNTYRCLFKQMTCALVILLIGFNWFVLPSRSMSSSLTSSDRMCALLQRARDGDPAAQCELGLAYYYGRGVLKDPYEAACWIKRAYDNGWEQARTIWNDLQLWQYPRACESLEGGLMMVVRNQPGDVMVEPVLGIHFVWVPKGCFNMGCSPLAKDRKTRCPKNASPKHKVCQKGFWMGQFEVTQAQWEAVMGDNPSFFNRSGTGYPVESVSFYDIQEFLDRANERMAEAGPHRVALPTEAQWEYACIGKRRRAETMDQRDSLQERPRPMANCGTCDAGEYRGRTAPTGSYPPNRLGLYDMNGNVREWCADAYTKDAYRRHAMKQPWVRGNSHDARVVRGGSWTDNADRVSCRYREKSLPGITGHNLGFRLVLYDDL